MLCLSYFPPVCLNRNNIIVYTTRYKNSLCAILFRSRFVRWNNRVTNTYLSENVKKQNVSMALCKQTTVIDNICNLRNSLCRSTCRHDGKNRRTKRNLYCTVIKFGITQKIPYYVTVKHII